MAALYQLPDQDTLRAEIASVRQLLAACPVGITKAQVRTLLQRKVQHLRQTALREQLESIKVQIAVESSEHLARCVLLQARAKALVHRNRHAFRWSTHLWHDLPKEELKSLWKEFATAIGALAEVTLLPSIVGLIVQLETQVHGKNSAE